MDLTKEERDDICYECTGYGDDYYIDEDGELVNASSDCPFNKKFEEFYDK